LKESCETQHPGKQSLAASNSIDTVCAEMMEQGQRSKTKCVVFTLKSKQLWQTWRKFCTTFKIRL